MANITLGEICDAVATTLNVAPIVRKESYNELTEGLNAADLPLIQAYWESITCDPSGGTDRTTFQAGRRQKQVVIHLDVYGAQRAHLGQDMHTLTDTVDALIDQLETQNTKPYFGNSGIQAFSWTVTRTIFTYAMAQYLGARFVIQILVY